MNRYQDFLKTAETAARAAGELQRRNFRRPLRVTATMPHDIKLALDVQSQRLIERTILRRYLGHEILGEEGSRQSKIQNPKSKIRWVLDPIDGTVNFFYNIPIFCVSIAAQEWTGESRNKKLHDRELFYCASGSPPPRDGRWRTVAGVIYDPMRDEMFSTALDQPTRLNGRVVRVSRRRRIGDSVCAVAFFKNPYTIRHGRIAFNELLPRVRKMRLLGAAALDMAYVACGRFDAYIEFGVKLWDIAAGLLLVENAGGRTLLRPAPDPGSFELISMSGAIPSLPRIVKW
ncbi:MAG: inositol monophosphatase [Verrucomicrobia bacterium]|nr:inositol monophosphatase [Verrucomicrobiota bacterium]